MAVRKLPYCPQSHVLFVILYRIYGLENIYCLITSTNYFINQKMLNI